MKRLFSYTGIAFLVGFVVYHIVATSSLLVSLVS